MTAKIDDVRQQLTIHRDSHSLRVVALILMLFAAWGLYMSITYPLFQKSSGYQAVAMLLSGTVLFGCSALILGWRKTIIDTRAKTVTCQWGYLVSLWSARYSLDEFHIVRLEAGGRDWASGIPGLFHVRLAGNDKVHTLKTFSEAETAREAARKVAKFCKLALMDSASDPTVTREWDSLDETVRDRALRERRADNSEQSFFTTLHRTYVFHGHDGESILMPPLPDPMRSHIEESDQELIIDIPPIGWTPLTRFLAFAGMLSGLACVVTLVFTISSAEGALDEGLSELAKMATGTFFILTISLLGLATAGAWGCAEIHVTDETLVITKKAPMGNEITEIPFNELKEFIFDTTQSSWWDRIRGRHHPIHARSDKADVCFGGEVEPGEQAYLYELIRQRLITD
jgi:hypothetical protein